MIEPVVRRLLRWSATAFQGTRRAFWFFQRPTTFGVHAVPVTARGTIVLVRLRYARGWRLPGGGRGAREDPRAAIVRELEEEIGLTAHGEVQHVSELLEEPDFKRDTVSLFIVRDVAYQPRWSLEVEAVTEAPPDRLPADLSNRSRRWLEIAGPLV